MVGSLDGTLCFYVMVKLNYKPNCGTRLINIHNMSRLDY
jgi:hypothetical protein